MEFPLLPYIIIIYIVPIIFGYDIGLAIEYKQMLHPELFIHDKKTEVFGKKEKNLM